MPKVYEGKLDATDGRLGIVVSRYNDSITGRLLSGAVETLVSAGVEEDTIEVAWVPGAWELPIVANRMVDSQRFDAVICLGAVIRGETTHDRHINRAVSLALGELSISSGVPVIFGLLTCETIEQAIQRAGGNVGNKGTECAQSALEMISLLRQIPQYEMRHDPWRD
jgi:6,7-dimethyl-8-ribityllumazine synthase